MGQSDDDHLSPPPCSKMDMHMLANLKGIKENKRALKAYVKGNIA